MLTVRVRTAVWPSADPGVLHKGFGSFRLAVRRPPRGGGTGPKAAGARTRHNRNSNHQQYPTYGAEPVLASKALRVGHSCAPKWACCSSSVNRYTCLCAKRGSKGSGFVTARAIAFVSTLFGTMACISSAVAAEGVIARALAATAESPVVATNTRIGGDDKQTRFVVDLNRKIDVAAFTLADPYRVVVDLPQITFNLPPNAGEQARGLVKAFRYGLIMQGGSRIVLDTKGPVRLDKAFVLDAAENQPARLVLDLVATDRAAFMRNIALENRSAHSGPARPSEPPPKIDGDPRPLIVLDPGHGGIDNGTKGSGGELEKDIVLAFTQTLREKLEIGGKYRVAMTRTDDTFVPLGERVRFARSRSAALFISVHADALPRNEGQAEGATVYTLSLNDCVDV